MGTNFCKSTLYPRVLLLSSAKRRGTPLLLSASVSDHSGNSPQVSAHRRSREIDQSRQRFHVGCGYANHGILLIRDDTLNCKSLDVGEMILILTNQAVFCNISYGNDTSFGAGHLYFDAKSC